MRWDNLRADQQEHAKLPIFGEEAVVRRFKTPEFAGMTFYEVRSKSILNHVPGDRFGFNWTINTFRGCSHACSYCFARPTHTYLDFDAGRDFETKIVVKVNAVELLHRELRRPSWKGELIAMGTNTDPYQRAEGHYKLMRGILNELNQVGNPYSILTKGTLIQRDIDLLSEGSDVAVNFSIGTVDEQVWRKTEPGTPHPMKRMAMVKKLGEAGIHCGVLMAPILPGISDSPEQLRETVEAAADAGATHIYPIVLHLRPGVKEEFMSWLDREYPELVTSYALMYPKSHAPKDVTAPIGAAVAELKRKHMPHAGERRKKKKVESTEPQQLSLEIAALDRKAPKWVKQKLKI